MRFRIGYAGSWLRCETGWMWAALGVFGAKRTGAEGAGCLSHRSWFRPVWSVREKICARLRPYDKITDVNAAGADDVTPDAEGDVVLAAQPGQRVQNPRIGGA